MKCWTCGGLHLAKLWGKGHCPNEFAEANGTAAHNKQAGVRCTYWIDKNKAPCGGTHSWEDHEAALIKFAPTSKGKGKTSEKGKGEGKGKGDDQTHSLTEPSTEERPTEDAFLGFMEAANWFVGESFAALTDARSSGQHASSTDQTTLEPECCEKLLGTSNEGSNQRGLWPIPGCDPCESPPACSKAGQCCRKDFLGEIFL